MSAEPDFDRLAQGTTNVKADQSNNSVKHPLQNRWTFWYKQPQQGGKNADWSKTLVKIVDIDTVEDFWALINNVKDPASLTNNSSYMLFKSTSAPEWEHPDNADGYKIEIPVPPKLSVQRTVNDMWEEMLMVLIGEQLGNASECINGAWVNIRARGNRFEIWIKKSLPVEALKEMGLTLKALLTEAPSLAPVASAIKLTCTRLGGNDEQMFEC